MQDAPKLNSFDEIDIQSRKDSFLKDLAERSGGKFFDVPSTNVPKVVKEIASELSHTYSLAYSPSTPPQNASTRKIKVELTNKKGNLRYKRGYENKK